MATEGDRHHTSFCFNRDTFDKRHFSDISKRDCLNLFNLRITSFDDDDDVNFSPMDNNTTRDSLVIYAFDDGRCCVAY